MATASAFAKRADATEGGPSLIGRMDSTETLVAAASGFKPDPYRYVLTRAEIAAIRRDIYVHRYPWAMRAWQNTLRRADEALTAAPQPTDPRRDLSDWNSAIFTPGEIDGNRAHNLAIAYAVGGDERYARSACGYCLAWAHSYWPLPDPSRIEHMIAESGGPVVKLCIAYDLIKDTLTAAERSEFQQWAAAFVPRAQANVDFCRDSPWVANISYGSDVSNPVPYGNSATWQRLMAVWAAAVVGGQTLTQTLHWNWQHTTRGGNDYGWDNLLEGLIIDGTGGELTEGRYRASIEYAHFSWCPLAYIADLAKHAGFGHDLFRYRTKLHRYSVFTPVNYYGRYLMSNSVPARAEQTRYGGGTWPSAASRWRAFYELLYRNSAAERAPTDRLLATVVSYGGASQRGNNYDVYLSNYNALLGRSPREPLA